MERADERLTTAQAFWHCASLVLGLGTLSVPYALSELGWAGIPLLALLAAISSHTAKLLVRCSSVTKCGTYPDIASAAFPKNVYVRYAVQAVLYVDLVASSALFLVFIAVNMHTVFPDMLPDTATWICVSAITLLPTAVLKITSLSKLSKLGTYIMLALVCGVLFEAFQAFVSHTPMAETKMLPTSAASLSATGNLVFAFAMHGTLLTIFDSMKRKQDAEGLFDYVYALGLGLKVLVGSAGYALFGNATRDQISLNFLASTRSPAMLLITVLVSLKKWSAYALPLEPVAIDLEKALPLYYSETYPIARVGLVFLTCAIALAVPSFGGLQALIGSVCASLLVLIFPIVFYLKTHRLSRKDRWMHFALLAGCAVLSAVSAAAAAA